MQSRAKKSIELPYIADNTISIYDLSNFGNIFFEPSVLQITLRFQIILIFGMLLLMSTLVRNVQITMKMTIRCICLELVNPI